MSVIMSRLQAGMAVALSWTLMGVFAALLCILPFRFLAKLLGRLVPPGAPPAGVGTEGPRARAVRVAVMRAVSLAPFRSDCLPQALCACLLCRMSGIPTVTFMGVRNDAGRLSAHAWVVAGGVTVSGGAERQRFHPVACFISCSRSGDGN